MIYNDVEEDDVNENKKKEMQKEKGAERIFKNQTKCTNNRRDDVYSSHDRAKRTKNSIAPIAKEFSIFTFFQIWYCY